MKSNTFNEITYKRKTNFDWNRITKENTVKERIEKWLYPITQNEKYDFILDVLQQNMEYILYDREEAFKSICKYFKIDILLFNQAIKEIQQLFIDYKKVRVCQNGKVILLGEYNYA